MIKTIADNYAAATERTRALVAELAKHSTIRHRPNLNSGSFGVITTTPFSWEELPAEVQPIRTHAEKEWRHLVSIAQRLLSRQSPKQQKIGKSLMNIGGVVMQGQSLSEGD